MKATLVDETLVAVDDSTPLRVGVTEQDVAVYLRGKGIKTWRAGGSELQAMCPNCRSGEPEVRSRAKWYLNTETWLSTCFVCGFANNRKTLLEYFGDEDGLAYEKGADPYVRRKIMREACDMAHEMLLANDEILEYLIGRGLTAEAITEAKLGYVPKNFSLTDSLPSRSQWVPRDLIAAGLRTPGGREFFNGSIVIPYFSHGEVVQLRERAFNPHPGQPKYRTVANDRSRIYNQDSLFKAVEVLIVEGEFDAMVAQDALRSLRDRRWSAVAVVGIAGAGSWPEGLVEYLETATTVFVGFDADKTGREFANKLKNELGQRGRLVDLPDGMDWSDIFARGGSASDVESLLIEADLAGKRLFSMREVNQKWTRRNLEAPGLKLGFWQLDSVIAPGLKPGQVMIPLAATGCIQGDAEIVVNRGGCARRMKLRELVAKFNGESVHAGKRSYSWDLSIPTRVQREENGEVRLATLRNAWFSGTKTTFTVTTETGRSIRATDEHPFLTERGWLRLDELIVGDLVHVRGERSSRGRKKINYRQRVGLLEHPFAGRLDQATNRGRVPHHRLVAEATLNGLEVEDFIASVRSGVVDGLQFLDPKVWAVHHVDHDPTNNDPGNLKVLTHSEHAALHAREGSASNVQVPIALERVVSIEKYGEEETFDLEVEDDPHNFIANGFVVHNTGKSIFLSNVAHNVRSKGVLYLSLELTAPEVFEHFRRIHKFWFPKATREEMLEDYALVQITEINRMRPGDLRELIGEYEENTKRRPALVLIDYLQYYARGFRGTSGHERANEAVMDIKADAKAESVAVIVPSQVNRGSQPGKPITLNGARDSGVIEETGDFVLSLFRPEMADIANTDETKGNAAPAPRGSYQIQLLKSRHGGSGKVFTHRASPLSLAIADTLDKPNALRIEQEVAAYGRGMTYAEHEKALERMHAQEALVGL